MHCVERAELWRRRTCEPTTSPLSIVERAGELVYRDRGGDVIALLHTEVEPKLQHHGLGSALVAGALDDARARGLRIVPVCPFVDAYVRRHPAYDDLVVGDPARRR